MIAEILGKYLVNPKISDDRREAIVRSFISMPQFEGVSSITDCTLIYRFRTFSAVNDSSGEILSITETVRQTWYIARRMFESQFVTVWELARDKDSPPYKTATVYSRIPPEVYAKILADGDIPRFVFCEVVEDENASGSGLNNALVDWCIKSARKALADKAESQ